MNWTDPSGMVSTAENTALAAGVLGLAAAAVTPIYSGLIDAVAGLFDGLFGSIFANKPSDSNETPGMGHNGGPPLDDQNDQNPNPQGPQPPVPPILNPEIHPGAQGKHDPDHNNHIEGRSTIHPDIVPQELLDGAIAGQYPSVGSSGRGDPVYDFGRPIGVDARSGLETRFGTVHSSKNGSHIVPANPMLY